MESEIYTSTFNEDAVKEFCALKNITAKQSIDAICNCIKKTCQVIAAISHMQRQRQEKYTKENPRHQQKLMQLWRQLKPEQKLQHRNSKQWIDVGFQDEDPATDFRGAGYLGLQNLVQYTKTEEGQACFKTATTKQTQFFFCSAGLFMTILSFNLLKDRKVDCFFDKQSADVAFQTLYNRLFNSFHQKWHNAPDKTMMAFNTQLKQFQRQMRLQPEQHGIAV